MWTANTSDSVKKCAVKCLVRRFTRSTREAFGRWCSTHVWFTDVHESASPTELASSFTRELNSATNVLFPTKVINIHNSDKPWMSPSLKQLILERQRAFYSGDRELAMATL